MLMNRTSSWHGYAAMTLHILASSPLSWSRDPTPSPMRMWQNPISCRQPRWTNQSSQRSATITGGDYPWATGGRCKAASQACRASGSVLGCGMLGASCFRACTRSPTHPHTLRNSSFGNSAMVAELRTTRKSVEMMSREE
jgi:hypothetical protein